MANLPCLTTVLSDKQFTSTVPSIKLPKTPFAVPSSVSDVGLTKVVRHLLKKGSGIVEYSEHTELEHVRNTSLPPYDRSDTYKLRRPAAF